MTFTIAAGRLVCLLVAIFGVCSAQTFVLAGRVVNSATGAPVKRALVSAMCFNIKLENPVPPVQRQMLTDAAGAFRFADLGVGNCNLNATKPQFQPAELAFPRAQIVLGPSHEDVELKLAPLATIEGTVTDGDGQPLQGANIQALEVAIVEGRRQLQKPRSVATDDRGHFRFWNLVPGKYYVKAAGRSGGTRQFLGERAPTFDSRECFVPVFFGGGTSLSGAQPIELKPGDHGRADFSLPMQPAFKIRGSLENFAPYQTVEFELLSGPDDASANRVTLNASQGRFEVQDVVPGSYKLRATQTVGEQKRQGEADVQVSASDVSDVVIGLEPGVDIPVKVHCDAPPCKEWGWAANITLTGVSSGVNYFAKPSPSAGEMRLIGVLPGEYRVTIVPNFGYVSAVAAGGVDLLSSRKLTVRPGAVAGPVEVWLEEGSASIEVALEGYTTEARILLVPAVGETEEFPVNDIAGTAEFRNLAPGDYTVYAVPKLAGLEYTNPEIIRALGEGTKVTLAEKDEQKIKLKMVNQ